MQFFYDHAFLTQPASQASKKKNSSKKLRIQLVFYKHYKFFTCYVLLIINFNALLICMMKIKVAKKYFPFQVNFLSPKFIQHVPFFKKKTYAFLKKNTDLTIFFLN